MWRFWCGSGPSTKPGARVEDRVVVDELDVAGLQVHVEAQVGAPRLLVEEVERRRSKVVSGTSRFTAPALIWLRM